MPGHLVDPPASHDAAPAALRPWEALVTSAVGTVIEYWGFKRNQGRVWALLYLRGLPLSAGDIQEQLELSKGAVSMITRELEQYRVVKRVRVPGLVTWQFVAETELLAMIRRVLEEREATIIRRAKEDLVEAERRARADGDVPEEVLARVGRMRRLATFMEGAVEIFLRTSQLDIRGIVGALTETARNMAE